MQPLDYLHVLCLAGIAVYIWRREPFRLLLTPLMLASFFVLYGVGNIVYFLGADTVPDPRRAVTLSLILMWAGLILGIEFARSVAPGLVRASARVTRTWNSVALTDDGRGDQLLAALGVLVALFVLAVFLGFGKPAQLLAFAAIDSAKEKAKYRLELGPQGGYLYQTLLASIAPFLSFLLLTKARVGRHRYLLAVGVLLVVVIFAGKLGVFQKVPWLIYLLQLMIIYQLRKSLEFGLLRILIFALVLVGGTFLAVMAAIPQLDTVGILSFLVYRFFEVNNEVIYETFYVYPTYLPHTWGMNIGLLHSIFGSGDLVSAHTQVANFFGAIGATFDAFFVADAWVDFGYGGVLAMSLLVGFAVKMVDLYVTSLGKSPLAVA
ncbi:MAG: hypothetical protein ACRDQZ_06300, partial [Mycobacteriales bacterium]